MSETPENNDGEAIDPALDPATASYWHCPFCSTEVPNGFTVCTGCRAHVVYGVTRAEWQSMGGVGAAVGGMTAALLVFYVPVYFNFPPGWGLGFYGVLPVGLVAAAIGFTFARIRDVQRRRMPPRFFPNTI